MAIYHCNISVATRGSGASAVAGAAYISRSAIRSEHDMQTYDYSRAHNYEQLVADLGVALPPGTPARFADRSTLWNEVEKIEKKSDAQLCRRIETALPDELPREEQIELAKNIVAKRVADGHIIDACVHSNDDGSNTHLHMLEPLRRCDENGFLPKSENVYTVRNTAGDEQQCNAAQFKQLKAQGYEKVYKYRKGNEWRELTPSEARAWDGCKRHSKTPIQQTRYLNNGWNDQRMAEIWRSDIAAAINNALAAAGEDDRVDHRSYARQGINKVPTIHEGTKVRALEQKEQFKTLTKGQIYFPATNIRQENLQRAFLNAEADYYNNRERLLRIEEMKRDEQQRAETHQDPNRATIIQFKRINGNQRENVLREQRAGVKSCVEELQRELAERSKVGQGGSGLRERVEQLREARIKIKERIKLLSSSIEAARAKYQGGAARESYARTRNPRLNRIKRGLVERNSAIRAQLRDFRGSIERGRAYIREEISKALPFVVHKDTFDDEGNTIKKEITTAIEEVVGDKRERESLGGGNYLIERDVITELDRFDDLYDQLDISSMDEYDGIGTWRTDENHVLIDFKKEINHIDEIARKEADKATSDAYGRLDASVSLWGTKIRIVKRDNPKNSIPANVVASRNQTINAGRHKSNAQRYVRSERRKLPSLSREFEKANVHYKQIRALRAQQAAERRRAAQQAAERRRAAQQAESYASSWGQDDGSVRGRSNGQSEARGRSR